MSSLRLAIQKSLEETGTPAVQEGDKKRKKLRNVVSKRESRPGEPPKMKRKRGRPRKHPRPEDLMDQGDMGDNAAGTKAADGDFQLKHDRSYGDDDVSSSENEFDDEEEGEDDEDDEEEDSDGEEGEVDEGEDEHEEGGNGKVGNGDEDVVPSMRQKVDPSPMELPPSTDSHRFTLSGLQPLLSHASSADSHSTHPEAGLSSAGGGGTEDEELRKQRKMLKKKLKQKHSAANKIQNQWKKKKDMPFNPSEATAPLKQGSEGGVAASVEKSPDMDGDALKNQSRSQDHDSSEKGDDDDDEKPAVKKKKNKTGVVPPPTFDVLERARDISEKEIRKHIDVGLRVKVRFATKVKKEGKLMEKKKWYGGRVSVVSKKRTKIKIKYDDGTSEICKFPDEDIVVDSVMNGEHSKPADFFLPRSNDDMEDEELEEGEVESPSAAVQKLPKEKVSIIQEEGYGERSKSPVVLADDKPSDFKPSVFTDSMEEGGDEETGVESTRTTVEPKTPVQASLSKSTDARIMAIMTSPEEGELSPGITTHSRPLADVSEMETIPAHRDSLVTSPTEAKMVDAFVLQPDDKPIAADEGIVPAAPKPKLAIRIPARKPTQETPGLKLTSSPAMEQKSLMDNSVADTSVNEDREKRKREDTDPTEEEPPTRRMKVIEGKLDEKSDQGELQLVQSELDVEMDTSKADVTAEPKPKTFRLKLSQNPSLETTEMDLAPPQQHVVKKKKKKSERANSPRPRSPLPKRAASPSVMTSETNEDTRMANNHQPIIDSVDSSLQDQTSGTAMEEERDAETNQSLLKSVPSLESLGGHSRGGRKAAQQAKERLITKEKERDALGLESSKKKKKKRPRTEDADADIENAEDQWKGSEWVQCDACSKWRILPSDVKVSSLPNLWYCHMNVYDPKRSTCDAPEQSTKQVMKERRKALKKAKRLEAEAQQLEAKKEKSDQVNTPVNSPKPTKGVKSGKVKEPKALATITEDQRPHSDSGSESHKEEKKKGKKLKPKDSEEDAHEVIVEPKKPGRKRGRPARNPATSSNPQPPARDSQDEDNVEWVQCEKCEKWRKLPPDISADELPDTWYCSMNTWNPSSASCEATEDKADAQHHEIGSSEWQLRQTHAGKYSYRQMIFGTGARKQNRPLSERSRAAESLFVKPVDTDEENPIPTTQYSKSSAFLPRTSNFNKSLNSMSDESIGIFDVLSHSNLWAQLRALEQAKPMRIESNTFSDWTFPKFVMYENLPDEIKIGMQQIVLQILGNSALPGDEVIREAQRFPWEDKAMVGYCNADVIINTLLALVRDGIVEMATSRIPNVPMAKWIPKYRRVRSNRALAAEEAIKSSKCMKIAKPWKQREEAETEWISGQQAFH